ncbi:predicted protein, partial [Thalassiosira pseudonana CCMP1335]
DKNTLMEIYKSMQLSRLFEVACTKQYMAGKIKGFMHLDNGQESIPAFMKIALQRTDKKYSYYREHCHALASGVDPRKIMAELCMKEGGTSRGAGGSMHIYDKPTRFQGGWALVAEQLPYGAGAAKNQIKSTKSLSRDGDNRIAVVFVGDGGSQNGRLPEILNACSTQKLPLLIVIIDNGRAINTFTPDVASNTMKFELGSHYNVPGILVDGCDASTVAKAGLAITDFVRSGKGPAVMQVHTYRFMGHSPADPEHERGRKDEKTWAREHCDPIKEFEKKYIACGMLTPDELKAVKKEMQSVVSDAVAFADASPEP